MPSKQIRSRKSQSAPSQNGGDQSSPLKVIPLGGLHEIGKNTCVFEYEDEIVLVDSGLAFPTDAMHGVNIVLPDIAYLKENAHKIKGMVVTHGHEDHIGGIPYHLKQFDIPVIYGPRLALALLGGKLDEAGIRNKTELRTVQPRDTITLGEHFSFEFIRNTHSMADSFTLAVTTPVGVVVFTGDFKFDHTPVDGENFDVQRLAEYGEKGVLCLFSDSTNAETPGLCPSERSVYPNLDRVFSQAEGRLMVTTFASSVHRVNMILDLAQKHGRSVAVVGRSMLNVISHARNLGYVKCDDSLFKSIQEIRNLADKDVLILTTGSQGEPMAALSRISRREHRQIQVKPGDTIVFSANPIPGNTISVVNTIDRLMMQGANVIYGRHQGIHVSGHGCQEDHKLMLALTRPKFFVPVHGEHRMLIKHSQTAQMMGVPAENMLIIDNGHVVELRPESISLGGNVQAGIELVDSSHSGTVQDKVLKERQQLAEDGVVTTAAAVGWDGKLVSNPEVYIRGVATGVEDQYLQEKVSETLQTILEDRWDHYNNSDNGSVSVDWSGLKSRLERELRRTIRRELRCDPLLVFMFQPPADADYQPETQSTDSLVTSHSSNGRGRSGSRKPAKATPKPTPQAEKSSNTSVQKDAETPKTTLDAEKRNRNRRRRTRPTARAAS
ncbi:ribonuclease J [Geitlerinema sp. P-1104]|uniref:ribonuclease J n=1 Tax=Geitlerinema sp. P-1104 TaxID=2546230 RepID=UPI0014769363|nr:ribonuclease J [Geitlerinema sp. P-1104]NMG57804.1 ribonuclease J [Geitlerinema sp. P-1104]